MPFRLWVNLWRDADNMEGEGSLAFLDDLFDKWASYYSGVTGITLRKISEVNEKGVSEIDYLKDTKLVRPTKDDHPR